jgi:nicotinate-nucleotide pyrophosphorylase (carboxylating)
LNTSNLSPEYLDQIIRTALEEDAVRADVTTDTLIPCDLQGTAYVLVKAPGVLAGAGVVSRVFQIIDASLKVEITIKDGTVVKPGDIPVRLSGNVRSILKGERVALNFIQRLSGIASTTAQYVEKVKDLKVDVADTRKTTPGLRVLEKYAVRMGGGRNHRSNLSEAVLIKDNHFAALRALGMSYKEIVAKAKQDVSPEIKVEAEATTIHEVEEAVEAGADIVMLDNMNTADMTRAVELIAGRAEVEASGNFRLNNIRSAAETGVDFISVGALTHSYNSLDISLEIETQTLKLI